MVFYWRWLLLWCSCSWETTWALLLESLCEWAFCWSELLLRDDWIGEKHRTRDKKQNCQPTCLEMSLLHNKQVPFVFCLWWQWLHNAAHFMLWGQTCICTDSRIPLHWSSFHTGSRRTSGEGLCMFLSLPLTDNGLTTLPLLHSLLIHCPHLLINLEQKPCVN